jgi:hypothetical protein
MKRNAIVVSLAIVVCSMVLQAQAPIPNMSPIIGVWKVNAEKSTYYPGPRPAAVIAGFQARQYVDRGNGLVAELRINVNPPGVPALANVWSGRFDGNAAPVFNQGAVLALLETGAKPMPTRAYKTVDPYTMEMTAKNATAVNATETLVVSRDGKTLTETIKTFNMQGQQNAFNVVVYDRQ